MNNALLLELPAQTLTTFKLKVKKKKKKSPDKLNNELMLMKPGLDG